jgi:hypothetical protein
MPGRLFERCGTGHVPLSTKFWSGDNGCSRSVRMPSVPDQGWWLGQPYTTASEALESPVMAIERKPLGVECITRWARRNDSRSRRALVHHARVLTGSPAIIAPAQLSVRAPLGFTSAVLTSRMASAPSIRGRTHRSVSNRTRHPPHCAASAIGCVVIGIEGRSAQGQRRSSPRVPATFAPHERLMNDRG